MSAFSCPRCQGPLGHTRSGKLRWWQCAKGHGRVFNLAMVRKRANKERYKAFWGVLRHPAPTGSLRCPSCQQPMEVSQHPMGTDTVELDHCRPCQLIWFDTDELTALTGPDPKPKADPLAHLDNDVRMELLQAQARLTMESTRFEGELSEAPSDTSDLATLGALVGFPVEDNAPARRVLPVLSWGLGAAILCGGVWALTDLDRTWETVGFYGEAPLRGGGLPALKSLLVDPRPVSVLLNAVVLFRLGDNVEDVLGRLGFAALMASATLAAWVTHATMLYTPDRPMTGLTAAAAALAVFYALRFPKVRLGWFVYRRSAGWFSQNEGEWALIGVRWAVGGWIAAALYAPWAMADYGTPNSWLEALVGAVVGAVAFWSFGSGMIHHPDDETPSRR